MHAQPTFTRPGLRVRRHTGVLARAYIALRATFCASCGRKLIPGQLFTFHGTRAHRSPLPTCYHCSPFDILKEQGRR